MTLHLVSVSSWNSPALKNCLDIKHADDALVLFGDGVFSLSNPDVPLPEKSFVLAEDLHLRFADASVIAGLANKATTINHQQWVALAIHHANSLSWF